MVANEEVKHLVALLMEEQDSWAKTREYTKELSEELCLGCR